MTTLTVVTQRVICGLNKYAIKPITQLNFRRVNLYGECLCEVRALVERIKKNIRQEIDIMIV